MASQTSLAEPAGPTYHAYMRSALSSNTRDITVDPAVVTTVDEYWSDPGQALKHPEKYNFLDTDPIATSKDHPRPIPILEIFDERRLALSRPRTLYEIHKEWKFVAATSYIWSASTRTTVHRPTLDGSLPGGAYDIESLWSFLSLAMDFSLEDLVVSFATGETIHLTPFQRAQRILVGSMHNLPSFRRFYQCIALSPILNYMSRRILPAVEYCTFGTMAEIIYDPSAYFILNVLVQYITEAGNAITEFLRTKCVGIVGRYEVCGLRIPPADELSAWLPAEINSIVNSRQIASLFASSQRSTEDMVQEENQIIHSRLALYACPATLRLTRCFVNKATDSVLLHGLYRTHGSTQLPVVIVALSAAIIQGYIKAVRTGCQSGSMFPVQTVSAVALVDQLLGEDQESWQIHVQTILVLLALFNKANEKVGSHHVSGESRPSPAAGPSRSTGMLGSLKLPGSSSTSPSASPRGKSPGRSGPGPSGSPASQLSLGSFTHSFQALKDELDILDRSVSKFHYDLIKKAEAAKKKRKA